MTVRYGGAPSDATRTGHNNNQLPATTALTSSVAQLAAQGTLSLLDAALTYAQLRLRVIPCEPDGKKPLLRSWQHKASDDPAVIRQWWAQWPDANIGLLTGYGIDVLDVDVKGGRNGMQMLEYVASFGLLRNPAAVVRTPSGGLHLWYRASGARSGAVGRQRELEYKGWGGYVLAYPSVIDGRRYEFTEVGDGTAGQVDWAAIKRLFRPAATLGRPPKLRQYGDPRTIERLARFVATSMEGTRNDRLFWAACEARRHGFAELAPLVEAARYAGLPDDEIMRTVASAELRQPLILRADQGGGHDD